MNSRQLNFFITPEDLQPIASFLKEQDAVVIRNKTLSPKDAFGYDIVTNPDDIFQIYLTKPEFLDYVYFQEISNYYYGDDTKSCAVEFSIGGFYPYSNKELHQARLYFIVRYYEESGALIQKSGEFINWADNLTKKFKKIFLRRMPEFHNGYFSDNCINWIKANNPKLVAGGSKLLIE